MGENLLALQPDYVVFVPKQRREIVGDRYNDHFQVFDKPDGTLFAAWTQATREGDVDQHVCFSRSRDKGRTWTEPVILAGSPNFVNPQPIASWQQPMVSKSGRIYMLWNQRVSNDRLHHGIMVGKYSDDDGDTWSQPRVVPFPRVNRDPADKPPSWCIWQRPLRLGKDGKYIVGLTRHGVVTGEKAADAAVPFEQENKDKQMQSKLAGSTVEFIQYDNIDDDPKIEDIKVVLLAANEKEMAVIDPKWGLCCQEASIVEPAGWPPLRADAHERRVALLDPEPRQGAELGSAQDPQGCAGQGLPAPVRALSDLRPAGARGLQRRILRVRLEPGARREQTLRSARTALSDRREVRSRRASSQSGSRRPSPSRRDPRATPSTRA